MKRRLRLVRVFLVAAIAFGLVAPAWADELAIARIYIEYNSSANDLGFHVFLDGEDWRTLRIVDPTGKTNFEVSAKGGYKDLGLTELFFEGAEPSLDEFPLEELLARFPEGDYKFIGVTVDGVPLRNTATLSHAVPAGPSVSAKVDDDKITTRWDPVTGPAEILPNEQIEIVGYQVIVDSFQVTLPAASTKVTVPREFVKSLEPGEQLFEVLAIDVSGNQTITEGSFVIGGDNDDDD